MTTLNHNEVDRIIEEFLNDRPLPTMADWKRLTDDYPQYASVFADAALVRMFADTAESKREDFSFDEELAKRTVSKALNRVHETPSWSLDAAQRKIASTQGPAVKKLAEKIGIGPYPGLLNGVLSGRTEAPRRLLSALSELFTVSTVALLEYFRRAHAASVVPSFKSTGSKPECASQPASWEAAVRSLKLSEDETARLLGFADES